MSEEVFLGDKVKEMWDTILTEEEKNKTITIPIKDLVWTMICYSYNMKEYEDISSRFLKEGVAARRDELGRLITQYSNFNTQRIYKETDKIFRDMGERICHDCIHYKYDSTDDGYWETCKLTGKTITINDANNCSDYNE